MGAVTNNNATVIKAAKKTLKKQESGSMKIKHLTKSLVEKFESDDDVPSCKKTLGKWIAESDVFEVDGKVVTLKGSSKKRKSMEDGNSGGSDEDKKAAKKAAKKAKKEKKSKSSSSSSTPADSGSIATWRKSHKIVLRDSRNGEEGVAATKLLATNEAYYPYETFDAPGCGEKIAPELIHQCVKVNGFEKPSPIQAQCWVSTYLEIAKMHMICSSLMSHARVLSHLFHMMCCSLFNLHPTPQDVIATLSVLRKLDPVKLLPSPCQPYPSCPKTSPRRTNMAVHHACLSWHPHAN